MPPASKRRLTEGRWRAIALSVLVHGLIVGAAVLGWFTWKHEPPLQVLAVQGTVVDARDLPGRAQPPEPTPPPEPPVSPEQTPPESAPPEEQGPPAPDPEELRRKEAERLAAEKAEAEKAEQLKREAQERERLEAEKQAAARAAAEKAAADKRAAEKRAAEKKKAEEAAARKAAEEKARLAREQEELRQRLEAEERGNAARNSAEANRWHAAIVAKIERAWIKPASAVPGVSCVVLVSQVPGGEVTSVKVSRCTADDAALRESVQNAVYSASPLPTPPAGVPFERSLELTFAPGS